MSSQIKTIISELDIIKLQLMKSSSTIIINNEDTTYKLSNIYKNMNFSNVFGQENKSSSINFNVNKFQNNQNNNYSNSNSTKIPNSIHNNTNKSINFNNTITNSQQPINQNDYHQNSKFSYYNNNIQDNNKPSSAMKDNKIRTENKFELKKKEAENKEPFSLSQNKKRELSASFNKVKQVNNPGNTINASSNINNVNNTGHSISNSQARQFINKPGKIYTLSHNKGSVIKPVNNMNFNNRNLNYINDYSNSKQQNDNSRSQNKNPSLSSNFQLVFNPTFSSSTLLSRTANKAKESITSKSAIFRSSARNININETNPTFSNNFSNSNNSTTLSGVKQDSNIINSRVNSNFQIQSNDHNNLDILTEAAYSNTFYLNRPTNLLSKLSEKPLFKDSIKIDSEGNNVQSTINLNTSNSNQLSTFNNISHSKNNTNSSVLKTPEGQFKYNDTHITSLQYVKFEEDKLNTVSSPLNEEIRKQVQTKNVNINDKVNLLRAKFEDLQSQLNDFRQENLRVKKLMEAIN